MFARMLCDEGFMEEREYQTYQELFQNMSNFMKKPNIIVHLDLTPKESLRRIQLRNRNCEQSISLEYLTALYKAYENFVNDIAKVIPVIKVDYQRFHSADQMAKVIKKEYTQISNIKYVPIDNFY